MSFKFYTSLFNILVKKEAVLTGSINFCKFYTSGSFCTAVSWTLPGVSILVFVLVSDIFSWYLLKRLETPSRSRRFLYYQDYLHCRFFLKASKPQTCGITYLRKKCKITENTSYILVSSKWPPFTFLTGLLAQCVLSMSFMRCSPERVSTSQVFLVSGISCLVNGTGSSCVVPKSGRYAGLKKVTNKMRAANLNRENLNLSTRQQ